MRPSIQTVCVVSEESGVWKVNADRFLAPEQIDEVDIDQYLAEAPSGRFSGHKVLYYENSRTESSKGESYVEEKVERQEEESEEREQEG